MDGVAQSKRGHCGLFRGPWVTMGFNTGEKAVVVMYGVSLGNAAVF